MLTLQDCLDFCDMERGEIDAIACHEHIPPVVAVELCDTLLHSPEGLCNLHAMFLENIEDALAHGEGARAQALTSQYRHFQATHPLPLP